MNLTPTLTFRKDGRTAVYAPRDRVHEKAIRGAMARHGWRLVADDGRPTRQPRPEAGRARG